MKLKQREEWERRLVRYLADRLKREFPRRFSRLDEASEWWLEHRDEEGNPPAHLLKEIQLLDDLAKWSRGQIESNGVHEESVPYQTNDENSVEWRQILVDSVLRERPYLFPSWQASSTPTAESELDRLVGATRVWREVLRVVRIAAMSDVTTLLVGETGTGKNLVAQVIHDAGARRNKRFIRIPCPDLTLENWDQEFEGIADQLNTGNRIDKDDRPLMDVGTVFLDDVSGLSMDVQPKLLRFLEDIEGRVNHSTTREAPRIVASCPLPLERFVGKGLFRRDLYFRLSIFQVDLPPLRQRRDDIQPLVGYLLPRIARKNGRISPPRIHTDALRKLERHSWPGNVRELSNVLERALLLAGDSIEIDHIHFEPSSYFPDDLQPNESQLSRTIDAMNQMGMKIVRSQPETLVSFLLSAGRRRFRTQDLADDLGVAPSTARAYLAHLVRLGFVRKFGAKKGTTYQVNTEKLPRF